MWRRLPVLAVFLTACSTVPPPEPAFVQVSQGRLRGKIQEDVVAYLGIPYAAPPVGSLRWRAPQPPAPWQGTRDATTLAPACMQGLLPRKNVGKIRMDEDCLYLNVWVPREHGEEPLPVFFWIHGGGFVNGSGSDPGIDGTAMAREGVIAVNINYRLGRFGLFAHPALTAADADDGRLANYWLLDQVAALEWVRDNIAAFGGDPQRVTIAGSSAGGVSVNNLMISPYARGLFAGAIAQSGPRRSEGRPKLAQAETQGLSFAARHGIEGEGAEALEALRALPADDIVDGLHMHTISEQEFAFYVLDGNVIPEPSEGVFRETGKSAVPVILGGNDADGFFPFFPARQTRDAVFAPFGALRAEAEKLYDPTGDGELRRYGTYAGADLDFLQPIRHLARQYARHGNPTWVYRFSYVPEALREERIGAWHASEVAFVFDTFTDRGLPEPTREDMRVADELRAYWLAFVRSGRPAPEGLPEWPRFDPDDDILLEFRSDGPVAHSDPARERLDLAARASQPQR